MTHDELLGKIEETNFPNVNAALWKVAKLHKPEDNWGANVCEHCYRIAWEVTGLYMDEADFTYPCPTIQAIEKELSNG